MKATRRYRSYRAPQADRQILCEPPWPALSDRRADGRHVLESSAVEIQGIPLAELRRDARRALIVHAQHDPNPCADASTDTNIEVDENKPLIITGHQPEFMHPGVWLKNFAAAQLAQEVGGTSVSLIIDNDLCRATSIRVPTGSVEQPRAVNIPFDQRQPDTPYEERRIFDRSLWNSFGDRVTQALAPLVPDPLIAEWWPEVVKSSESTELLGLAIARARHRLQMNWGSHSLEVAQSQVCQAPPFHRFALHLLSAAPRLRQSYNHALADYRQAHNLRSAAQPLPDLSEVEGWIETPFWIWTQENPTRRALFAQSSPQGILLSDRLHWQDALPRTSGGDSRLAIQRLAEWHQQGVKLRSRALITTLYARLLLADMFIHGIGGANYDQVTDSLCQSFYGIIPPAFVTLSGTLRLPIEHQSVSSARLSELRQTLRELHYHPESLLSQLALDQLAPDQLALDPAGQLQVASWIAQKKRWIKIAKDSANAAERHVQIVAANEGMQPWLEPLRKKVENELAATVAQTRRNQLLESREYPFCLFPRDLLRKFLLDFRRHIP